MAESLHAIDATSPNSATPDQAIANQSIARSLTVPPTPSARDQAIDFIDPRLSQALQKLDAHPGGHDLAVALGNYLDQYGGKTASAEVIENTAAALMQSIQTTATNTRVSDPLRRHTLGPLENVIRDSVGRYHDFVLTLNSPTSASGASRETT